MRLIKYKVNKFRSVKETEWIEIDQWTCFVGVNESGKTNLLLALWKFNPADESTKIDLLLDYPRDEYSRIEDQDGVRKSESFIDLIFELNENEINDITNCYNIYFKQLEEKTPEVEETNEINKITFTNWLRIEKDYDNVFYIYVSNENGECLTNEIQPLVGDELFYKICQQIPKFVYYSEYGNLDSDLNLPRVIEDLNRIKSLTGKDRLKARTLKILFEHAKLKPAEIQSLGHESNTPHTSSIEDVEKESRNKQERHAKVTSAATYLTNEFKNWWSQGDYIFHFNLDGNYFRIFVSDTDRPSQIALESRSKGLQWFFSFFLVFLAESENEHRDCILLLDEPGLSLHPNAQTDLIKFFNQLSQKNQLIYTTHLPFLVDHNNLDRVKAVYTEKGLTKASNDLSKADKEKMAIQPINAAIGITASQSLLVGCDIVIVEGVSDQFYLSLIKNYLVSIGKFKPKRELVFIPVGGAKAVKPVISIIHGSNSDLPILLLDSDVTGKNFQQSLRQGLYSNDTNKIIETDTFTGKSGSEIEDLIPVELLIECFDRLFRCYERLDINDIKTINPIVPQLIKFAEANQIDLKIGWKVELCKKVKKSFKGRIDPNLEIIWKQLFDKLQ